MIVIVLPQQLTVQGCSENRRRQYIIIHRTEYFAYKLEYPLICTKNAFLIGQDLLSLNLLCISNGIRYHTCN